MHILGIMGWSGAGKTTLIENLLPRLRARAIAVSTVKHAHHGFDPDRPGKDSYRHRQAGAQEVLIVSDRHWALMADLPPGTHGEEATALPGLLARMKPVDLVLVEGFKNADCDKLEVHRAANGKPALFASDPRIVAVASDAALAGCDRPVFGLDGADEIAGFICGHFGLPGRS